MHLANQLKARLFDKGNILLNEGFSYGTLPSVKREVKNQIDPNTKSSALVVTMGRGSPSSQNKIIKHQSSIFKKHSLPKNKFEKVEEPPLFF